MIVPNQTVTQIWNNKTKTRYEQKGYKFTKRGDSFNIKVEDLLETSKIKIKVKCDYCGCEIEKSYSVAIKDFKHSCKKCYPLKTKETTLIKYGVDNVAKLDSVKQKTKQHFIDKYGVDNPLKDKEIKNKVKNTNIKKYGNTCAMNSKEIQEKIKQSNIKKYGVEYYVQTDEFKDKYKQTSLNKYGVEHPFQSDLIKEKIKQSFIDKYGVDNNMKSEEGYESYKKAILKKYGVDNLFKSDIIKSKIKETMYGNDTAPSSKAQRYICDLLNGELNYPIDWYSLDIAFPNEMIYIEYDGSGHDLQVQLGYVTNDEFKNKEQLRNIYLNDKGWKLIRINNKKDILPDDQIIIDSIIKAKDELKLNNKNIVYIEF